MTSVETFQGDQLKKGDTEPSLRLRLYEDGEPKNISGYTAEIRIRKTTGDPIIVDTQATVRDARAGVVEHTWTSTETEEAGLYEGEVTIDDGAGSILTFPNDSMFNIHIMDIIE